MNCVNIHLTYLFTTYISYMKESLEYKGIFFSKTIWFIITV